MNLPWLKLLSGPLLFGLCLLLGDAGLIQVRMLACLLWMLAWWMTQVLPIGVTALLPILLFPLLNILNLADTTVNYANPVIFLFFGGFILGLAIEKWHLHKRIALHIMLLTGERPNRVILGSMLATALLSMWISNTATTVMMLPIGLSVIELVGSRISDARAQRNFALTLMLGIAYAANVGGMATLIGTPPNLVLAGIASEKGLVDISFAHWFIFALPLVILLFSVIYICNIHLIFPIRIRQIEGIRDLIRGEIVELPIMKKGEKRVLIVLSGTALLWIFRAPLAEWTGLSALSDPIIAILAAVVLFALPSGEGSGRILEWPDTTRLPWGILLLFGGGLSLAKGMEVSAIVELVGDWISSETYATPLLLMILICALAVFLTEVMSNVALVSVFIPVSLVIAQNLGMEPMQLALPLTLGASCAFMFPIATPPNAIVFSSGHISMAHMARAGLLLNILCILIIAVYCWLVQGYFF